MRPNDKPHLSFIGKLYSSLNSTHHMIIINSKNYTVKPACNETASDRHFIHCWQARFHTDTKMFGP